MGAARRLLVGAVAAAGAAATAVAVPRYLVGRARRATPGLPAGALDERPPQRSVRGFDGTRLTVAEVGPAGPRPRGRRRPPTPTVVFVHGFSLDLTTWRHQWTHLEADHRCVLYDARGHGDSGPAGAGGYTLEALAADLRSVLDETVGEGPAVLVGHSLGGICILTLAARHPEEFGTRVVGAAFLDSAAGRAPQERALPAAMEGAARAAIRWAASSPAGVDLMRAAADGAGFDLAYLVAATTNFGPGAPAGAVEHVVRTSTRANGAIWTHLVPRLLTLDLRDAASLVRVPSLVLVGSRDRITSPSAARALAAALPDARLVAVPGAGHLAMMEQPARVNRALDELLETVEGRS